MLSLKLCLFMFFDKLLVISEELRFTFNIFNIFTVECYTLFIIYTNYKNKIEENFHLKCSFKEKKHVLFDAMGNKATEILSNEIKKFHQTTRKGHSFHFSFIFLFNYFQIKQSSYFHFMFSQNSTFNRKCEKEKRLLLTIYRLTNKMFFTVWPVYRLN